MIYMHELIDLHRWEMIPLDHKANLSALHHKLNSLRAHYGKAMIINSGYRTREQHEKIYDDKNVRRKAIGQAEVPIPWGSQHLMGAAADLRADQDMKHWVLDHMDLIERLDLYFEGFDYTNGWIHCQLYPPKSGQRFFDV